MQPSNKLANLAFFNSIKKDTLDALWDSGRILEVPQKALLFRAKEPAPCVYFQITGKSILYNLTHSGKRKIVFVLGPGTLLNDHVMNLHEASLFCEALEAGKIFEIPTRRFLELMEQDFDLTRQVLVTQERKLWRLGHQLKNTNGSIHLERKLAAKLWKLSRDFGIRTPEGILIDLKLSVTFLADMLGAPRETTSKLCKLLCDYGLMTMDKKKIVIINPEKMAHFYKTGDMN